MIDPEKLTYNSQQALIKAQELARDYRQPQVLPLHLFLALIVGFEGVVVEVLKKLEISLEDLVTEIEQRLEALPRVGGELGQVYLSRELGQVLTQAYKEAKDFGDEFVSREHLFLALLEVDSQTKEIAQKLGITKEKIKKVLAGLSVAR